MICKAGCTELFRLVSVLLLYVRESRRWMPSSVLQEVQTILRLGLKECSDYRLPSIFQYILGLENNYFPGREVLSNRFGCHA